MHDICNYVIHASLVVLVAEAGDFTQLRIN